MNPTRNTARTPMELRGISVDCSVVVTGVFRPGGAEPRLHTPIVTDCLNYLALLEADFTTERAKDDLGCGLSDGTKEGTSGFHGKTGVSGLERKIVLHLANNRVRAEIGRDVGRRPSLNVAGVGGELIGASRSEIAFVGDLPAAGRCLNQGSGHRFQMDFAADRRNFDVAVANVGQSDGAAHGAYVDMAVLDIAHIDDSIGALERQVALQAFCRQGTGR